MNNSIDIDDLDQDVATAGSGGTVLVEIVIIYIATDKIK